MKNARYLWVVLLLAVLALLAVLLIGNFERGVPEVEKAATAVKKEDGEPSTEAAAPDPALPDEQRQKAVDLVKSIYSAPIRFHGLVQDQNGNPVEGAQVTYSIIDKFWEPGSKRTGVSDATGRFALEGVQGAALTVGVSKNGYDPIYGQSNGSFAYGTAFDPERDRPTPSENDPAVFVLRKQAPAEDLLVVSSRQYNIGKNGGPVSVNLETGRAASGAQGHIGFEASVDNKQDARGRFDWSVRISVPGGGLMERDPEQDFEAPSEGYRPADEIVINKDNPDLHWASKVERDYFIRLADGRFARTKVVAYAGQRTFVVLESYLNPSGSRNLEYDPSKVVRNP